MDHFTEKYEATGAINGASCILEDTIMIKGRHAAAGSKILEGFISPFSATVVSKLEEAGITIIGRAKTEEFGAAGIFSACAYSGAVEAVADGDADFALCNDYTGVISGIAAARGLCYIRPTYGSVSRYGLIPAMPSIDQIGIVCKTPEEGFEILRIISGSDPGDGAMLPSLEPERPQIPFQEKEGQRGDMPAHHSDVEETPIRIGVPAGVFDALCGDGARLRAERDLLEGGFQPVEVQLRHVESYAPAMQILCSAELSGSISRYDGIKFGYRADGYKDLHELYVKTRSQGLGYYAKLAAIMGALALSRDNYARYYDKAMRVRRLIKESLDFGSYDAIMIPAAPEYNMLPGLCGLPGLTLPGLTLPGANGAVTVIADGGGETILRRFALKARAS